MNKAYSQKLQCNFIAWRVLTDDALLLELPKWNCCDMGGAILVAKSILPDVRMILVCEEAEQEFEYRLSTNGEWEMWPCDRIFHSSTESTERIKNDD